MKVCSSAKAIYKGSSTIKNSNLTTTVVNKIVSLIIILSFSSN